MKALSSTKRYALVENISLILLGLFAMVLAASIRVPLPFTPVPLTLQTLVVYLSLRFLRTRAVIAQVLYVGVGISGVSVFTNSGSGLLYLFGPTGGYLVGFLVSSLVMAYFFPRKSSLMSHFFYYSFAALIIYSFGIAWLMMYSRFSLPYAFHTGVLPFICGEILKISFAAYVSSASTKQRQ